MSQFDDVRQFDPDDFSGAEQRSVRMNNSILETVQEQDDVFCTYMAEVRWLVLQLTREKFASAAEIDETAVRGMERTGSVPTNSTLHRVYTYFSAVEDQYRPHNLADDFLDLAVRERYGASRRKHAPAFETDSKQQSSLSVTQMYNRWAIMKTLSAVEKASGIRGGGIWQREATGVIPEFVEMRKMHKKLKLPEQELDLARSSWTHDRSLQLLGREVPPALADFLTRLEVNGLPSFTASSVRTALDCTFEQAQILHSGQMVPFDVISSVAHTLYESEDLQGFVEEWETQFAEDQELPRFGPSFMRIRDQINVSNKALAKAMGICAPEHRGPKKGKKRVRSELFRPSHLIRETLETAGNSKLAPAGVLVGLLSHAASISEQNIPDVEKNLRDSFYEQRSRSLKRSGAAIHSNPLRLARDYWGFEREDLAEELGMSTDEILALEKSNAPIPKRVLSALEKLGEGKLELARQRWIELIQPPEPTSVQNLFIHLQRKAGSFQALESLLSTNRHESKRGKSGRGLAIIATGDIVPPWPMLERVCTQSGLLTFPDAKAKPAKGDEHNLHEKLWRDWSVKYSDALFEQGKTDVLARSLHHLYGQKAESLRDFMIQHMSVSYPTQTRVMQRLEAEEFVQWAQVGRTLDAAGLNFESAQYVFIKALHETGSVKAALLHARNAVRSDKAFEHESYSFGLTSEERKKYNLQP